MTSAFNGAVDGHVVIPAPHCGPGGTMHFNFGPTLAHGMVHNDHLAELTLSDQRPKREPLSTVPFSRDADFVDRPDISAWILQKCTAPASRAALVGLGGVGKSQLAIQYCHDARAAKPATWVFWVHAGTRARFEEAYRSIADRLELLGRDDPKNNVLALVRDWLCDEANGQWIMVLDNADDVEMFYPKRKCGRDLEEITPSLAAFVPQSHNGSILVTSRSKDAAARLVGGYKSIRDVHAMDDSQALQLLRMKLEDTSDERGMVDLIKALDRIPLAITQAAAYINRGARMTVQRYLEDFWRCDRKKSSLLNRDAGDLRRDESASNSVITTWEISFKQIRKERPSAADLLSLMSFFNPQGIPESVLRAYTEKSLAASMESMSMAVNDSAFEDDLNMLIAYSLVKVTADMEVCEMHQLVQFCTREWLSLSDQTKQWRRRFTALMARVFPSGAYENWPKCQMLLPHVEPMFKHEAVEEEMLEDWAQVLSNAGWYLWMKGQYVAAERAVVKAIQTRKKRADESIDTLSSVSILASVLQDQGKYEAAEEMNRRALEGREKALGKDHPDTLTSVYCLAHLLHTTRCYTEAGELYQRAYDGHVRSLGPQHPRTIACGKHFSALQREAIRTV
ncbi:hypothetical protein EJ04DRAFT_469350 [Polyplosphaeria fusca]|uniref:Kinesin light chain n=1 Tax=Polyplosphaeria fusca TaxID=682080 RepID=A0A9P4QY00_9PLEO|nr:hypothetical protein EJ04DRAFT_469350 [Polyplosphaeria fusca]